jgi:hypothetical protein
MTQTQTPMTTTMDDWMASNQLESHPALAFVVLLMCAYVYCECDCSVPVIFSSVDALRHAPPHSLYVAQPIHDALLYGHVSIRLLLYVQSAVLHAVPPMPMHHSDCRLLISSLLRLIHHSQQSKWQSIDSISSYHRQCQDDAWNVHEYH